ncbi:MAG: hypothetical protein WC554_18165, partial [Clostridia bacterium]
NMRGKIGKVVGSLVGGLGSTVPLFGGLQGAQSASFGNEERGQGAEGASSNIGNMAIKAIRNIVLKAAKVAAAPFILNEIGAKTPVPAFQRSMSVSSSPAIENGLKIKARMSRFLAILIKAQLVYRKIAHNGEILDQEETKRIFYSAAEDVSNRLPDAEKEARLFKASKEQSVNGLNEWFEKAVNTFKLDKNDIEELEHDALNEDPENNKRVGAKLKLADYGALNLLLNEGVDVLGMLIATHEEIGKVLSVEGLGQNEKYLLQQILAEQRKQSQRLDDVAKEAAEAKEKAATAEEKAATAEEKAATAEEKAATAEEKANDASKRATSAKEESAHALRRTGSDDCLIGAIMDPEVREEADRRLRIEAEVEFGPYVVKDLYTGVQIINQVYDEFIARYEKVGNYGKADVLRNEKLTAIKANKDLAVEIINNNAGRISILAPIANNQYHVLQVIGYDLETGKIHYAEDNGDGHNTAYGEIELVKIAKINDAYVFIVQESVVNEAKLEGNVLSDKEQSEIKNVGGTGAVSVGTGAGSTGGAQGGTAGAGTAGNGGSSSPAGADDEEIGAETDYLSRQLSKALIISNIGKDPKSSQSAQPEAMAPPVAATATVSSAINLSAIDNSDQTNVPAADAFAGSYNQEKAISDSTVSSLLNNIPAALDDLTKEQERAARLFNRFASSIMTDKLARREEEDYMVALLKKLLSVIKTRGLDLHGNYFRAARLIAHKFGLPYSSMIQLATAFILLNETESFIEALKEEQNIRAEIAARNANSAVEETESVNENEKSGESAVNFDLLANVRNILVSVSKSIRNNINSSSKNAQPASSPVKNFFTDSNNDTSWENIVNTFARVFPRSSRIPAPRVTTAKTNLAESGYSASSSIKDAVASDFEVVISTVAQANDISLAQGTSVQAEKESVGLAYVAADRKASIENQVVSQLAAGLVKVSNVLYQAAKSSL